MSTERGGYRISLGGGGECVHRLVHNSCSKVFRQAMIKSFDGEGAAPMLMP